MDRAARLREQFPVFERFAYLNAGTCGPLPAAALRAGADSALTAAEEGRGKAYYERLVALSDSLRARYAQTIGASTADVALTTSTSDGIVRAIAGLDLRAGDEVLTAPDEHPGLLGPLAAARRLLGIVVRTAPFARLAEAVTSSTRLVACSHVSWVTGAVAPAALAEVGAEIAVLFDGAQGAGAIAVDPAALGCSFYASSGQKWLCGPVGTGFLWIAPEYRQRLAPLGPTYVNLTDPYTPLESDPWPDARAHDTSALSAETLAAADAAVGVLAAAGWPEVHARATGLAAQLVQRLADAGRTIAARGDTTLVTWEDPDPEGLVERCEGAGVVIRNLPGTSYVRASVGAWNDESDLDRLLACLSG